MIAIPIPLFVTALHNADNHPTPIKLCGPNGEVAKNIFELLRERGENLSSKLSSNLTNCALYALVDLFFCSEYYSPCAKPTLLKKFLTIRDYIINNYQDSDLNAKAVSYKHSMSERYLCKLMEINKTSLSKILWKTRLDQAKILLRKSAPSCLSITEVSKARGFKSAAHFSRSSNPLSR